MNVGTFYESYLRKLTSHPSLKKHEYTTQFFEINLSTRTFSYRDSEQVSEIKCIHTGKDLIDYQQQLEESNEGIKAEWTYGFSLLTKARQYILYAENLESYTKWMLMLEKYFKEPLNTNKEHFENFINYEEEDEDAIQILSSMNEKERHIHAYGHTNLNRMDNSFANNLNLHDETTNQINISRFFEEEKKRNQNIKGGGGVEYEYEYNKHITRNQNMNQLNQNTNLNEQNRNVNKNSPLTIDSKLLI